VKMSCRPTRQARSRRESDLPRNHTEGALSGRAPSAGAEYALFPGAAAAVAHDGVAEALRAYGPTAVSSHYADARDLARALHEAELMLEVVALRLGHRA
jgi:hypothetical protein